MTVGSYPGMANFPDVDPVNDAFFLNLLPWAGIERPVTTSHDGRTSNQVEVRLQENSNGLLVFVLNHSEKHEEVTVDLSVTKEGWYKVRDVINNNETRVRSSGNLLKIKASLDRKQVAVLEIVAAS